MLHNCKALALKIWRMLSTPSMPLLPGPIWPGMVAPKNVLSIGDIETFDIKKQ